MSTNQGWMGAVTAGDAGRPRIAAVAFVLLAAGLLAATLAWHVPMMLWDHLDLLPMYQAWQERGLAGAGLWEVHDGSHLHAAAYLALMATTALSDGRTWLDCLIGFGLLLGYAALVLRMARISFSGMRIGAAGWTGLVFLALYPGHLANLQWGWQVAVFLCLLGAAICVHALGTGRLGWRRNLVALAGAVLASASFATGLALLPAALVMIALRHEAPPATRAVHALPWIGLGMFTAWKYGTTGASAMGGAGVDLPSVLHYALNFLGGGLLRFATDIAPWVVLLALLAVVPLVRAGWRRQQALPWLGLMLFGLGCALLTALGRVGPFGVEHAFVTRYASFASVFWLGWLGLLLAMRPVLPAVAGRWLARLAVLLMVFAVANALHLSKKAARIGQESRETVRLIRTSFPDVDEAVLADIYFGRVDLARERLQALQAYGFVPFERDSVAPAPAPVPGQAAR